MEQNQQLVADAQAVENRFSTAERSPSSSALQPPENPLVRELEQDIREVHCNRMPDCPCSVRELLPKGAYRNQTGRVEVAVISGVYW